MRDAVEELVSSTDVVTDDAVDDTTPLTLFKCFVLLICLVYVDFFSV
jgi:hypothetical protein